MAQPEPNPSSVEVAAVDCWNTIGIRGDSSCPELAQYIHCRHCPVYRRAAGKVLDIAPPAGYIEHWTGQVARAAAFSERDSHSVLIFRIGTEWFALSTSVLQEIAGLRTIHSIPHRRDGTVLGMANVRGELLVCISLRHVLRIEASGAQPEDKRPGARERLIVLRRDNSRLACPVDEVHGIQRYRPNERAAVPATVARATATYTQALLPWQSKWVGLLDDQLLFHSMNRSLA